MDPVDFYRLPRAAQERFKGSVNGTGLPAPILRKGSRPLAPIVWTGVSGVCFVVLVVLFVVGYGDLTSGVAREGVGWCVADIVIAGLLVFGLVRAAAVRAEHAASPFRRGLYVFPVGLIDARTPTLRMYRIEDLGGVFGPDVRGLTLDFGGTSFSFPIADEEAADRARKELDGARGAIGEADAARESVRPKALAALDPLQGYANPLASSDSLVRIVPQWATFGWAIAAFVGVMLGASLWMIRNAKSDDAIYARAALANDSGSYRAYLDRGTRHSLEVSQVLLPRALLSEAVKIGTVDAIQEFIAAHPERSIAAESLAARKTALLAELDLATKAGTLAALDDFAHRRPDARLDAELAVARHNVYAAALERYTRDAPAKGAPTAFVERLLAWAESKGPRVEIRFHRLPSKTLEKADHAVGKNAQFKGVVSLPSRYFDDPAEKADLATLAAAISQRFAQTFPAELLSVSVGEPIADPDAPLPAQIASPTMFIEHGAQWSGSIQASQKQPRGVFVGLELGFEAQFRLPDTTKPVRVKVNGWHLPNLATAKDADLPEDAVYREMRQKAVEPFQKKLLATFFRDGM
jgi:hypothetical protein